MLQTQQLLLLLGIFVLLNISPVNSVACYECTVCPEPFTTNYPYVTVTNNTNFLSQCTKTVVTLGDGSRLVSKGSVFSCPSGATSGDVKIYCCGSDYCNSSSRLMPSFLLGLVICMRIYIFSV